MSRRPITSAIVGLAMTLGACGGGGSSIELTIYGAASLKGVLTRAAADYEVTHPGTNVTLSTDSSSALKIQIEQGAPVDVFLSADAANPQALVDQGLAAGGAQTFAVNQLAVIVPLDNPAGIRTPADLAKPGVRIIAAGDEVPITKYATQVVANLATQPTFPLDLPGAYDANIVSKENNVRATIAKIELGEGDAAIVYVTDARASTKVTTIELHEAANVRASYAGVVIKTSPNPEAAQAFLTWFAGPDGQALLSEFGFMAPT